MTEALRMMDVPKDIPEQLVEKKPAKVKPGEFDDVALADLGGQSIMDDDPTVKQLLAAQMKPDVDPDAIPAPGAAPAKMSEFAAPELSGQAKTPAPLAPIEIAANQPVVPDYRGKSMREVVEESASAGIDVTIEGSGVARAQTPLPGSPLHQGERIRIVFTR